MAVEMQIQKPTVEELVATLASVRNQHAIRKQTNREMLDAFTAQHVSDFEAEKQLAQQVSNLESLVKSEAVTAYSADPAIGKKPFPGIGIRVAEKRDVQYNIASALGWAKSHDMCLSLDTKAFETICENESTRPDFVVVVVDEVVSATIATDLSKVLEVA